MISGSMLMALNILPCLALFAKVTPIGIEGTIFAFLTGADNFANGVFGPLVGEELNRHFVGVTAKD